MIESFVTGIYPVKRPIADGAYIDGIYQPSAVETIQVIGSLQPLSAKESLLLPENERNRESFNFFTEIELFPASENGIRQADIVLVDGVEFVVRSVERWRNTDISYFKSILQRINDQEDSP